MKQALLAAVCLAASVVAPAIRPNSDPVFAAIPVVVCQTSSGAAPVMPHSVPSEARVPAADRGLEVYSIVGGWFEILAPLGIIWPTGDHVVVLDERTCTHENGGESKNSRHNRASSVPRPRVDSTAR